MRKWHHTKRIVGKTALCLPCIIHQANPREESISRIFSYEEQHVVSVKLGSTDEPASTSVFWAEWKHTLNLSFSSAASLRAVMQKWIFKGFINCILTTTSQPPWAFSGHPLPQTELCINPPSVLLGSVLASKIIGGHEKMNALLLRFTDHKQTDK